MLATYRIFEQKTVAVPYERIHGLHISPKHCTHDIPTTTRIYTENMFFGCPVFMQCRHCNMILICTHIGPNNHICLFLELVGVTKKYKFHQNFNMGVNVFFTIYIWLIFLFFRGVRLHVYFFIPELF